MSDEDTENSSPFKFLPEYADCIANVASSWATLEYHISSAIWGICKLEPVAGACVTSQIYTVQGKLSALLALLKLHQAPEALVTRVNKFSERVRGPQEMRNRIIHDIWLVNNFDSSVMGRLEVTAPKKLSFKAADVQLTELQQQLASISEARTEAYEIRKAIQAALPTLPGIPSSELHPTARVR